MVAIDYDPIALGYGAGLARPGGSITGVFFQQLELTAKRIQILKETVSGMTRAAIFWDAFSADQLRAAQAATQSVGVQLAPVEFKSAPYNLDAAFASTARGRPGAFFVCVSPVLFRERARIKIAGRVAFDGATPQSTNGRAPNDTTVRLETKGKTAVASLAFEERRQ